VNEEQRMYLESGVVEDYCLGTASIVDVEKLKALCSQFSRARAYLETSQKAMETFFDAFSRPTSIRSKDYIVNNILANQKLKNAKLQGSELMLPEFIDISRHSNVDLWGVVLEGVQAPSDFEHIFSKPLYVAENKELILVWARELVPDEWHDDMHESFLLLEGTVDCYVDGTVYTMERGDYMDIPLHAIHKVIVTSETPGKAIRSRVSL